MHQNLEKFYDYFAYIEATKVSEITLVRQSIEYTDGF